MTIVGNLRGRLHYELELLIDKLLQEDRQIGVIDLVLRNFYCTPNELDEDLSLDFMQVEYSSQVRQDILDRWIADGRWLEEQRQSSWDCDNGCGNPDTRKVEFGDRFC